MFRSFDYKCIWCNYEEQDVVIEIVDGVEENVICPDCQNKMDKIFPVPNFAFGNAYFYEMGPRRIETQFLDKDGRLLKHENLTHKIKGL